MNSSPLNLPSSSLPLLSKPLPVMPTAAPSSVSKLSEPSKGNHAASNQTLVNSKNTFAISDELRAPLRNVLHAAPMSHSTPQSSPITKPQSFQTSSFPSSLAPPSSSPLLSTSPASNKNHQAQKQLHDLEAVQLVSLRSSVGEKLKRYLTEYNGRMSAEMDVALDANKQLTDNEMMVQSGVKHLEDEEVRLRGMRLKL